MENSSPGDGALNLEGWVRERISGLRPRLLDLTRRNPLLSTKLNPRSNSYIRVVDELPDVLAFSLSNRGKMRFEPLPKLDSDPKDEKSSEFRSAFAETQRIDEEYTEAISNLSSSDPESEEKTRQLDRQLKDQVREALGMPPREISGDVSLAKHAQLHHISPHYDLPLPTEEHKDGRHTDKAIQTLLLPDQLERKFNSLITKCNTWIQETGINVLHAAYGFLEWQDSVNTKSAFAPLVLMPASVTKRKTPAGPEFWIEGLGEGGETNLILAEMLKRQFDLDLPSYNGGSIEKYFEEVAELKPKNLKKFMVRRQAVFGVFPSARMAMYHDLDPDKNAFYQSPIISQLLGGTDAGGATPFADEHDVESPEIESKIPCIITEADSSQLSALVDLAEGKSIAVEGPPGTGKSQTIVNAIAAAIADGKRVLFVAEKMAALEVVKARLESVGLGEFLLPLQAERSTREQVISSVRDRLTMTRPRAPREYEEKLAEYRRVRSNLNAYVETISTEYGLTGMTVYEVLGKSVSTQELLSGRNDVFINPPILAPDRISKTDLQQAIEAAGMVDTVAKELIGLPEYWSECRPDRTDKIELDQIRGLAADAARACQKSANQRSKLAIWNISYDAAHDELKHVHAILGRISEQELDYSPEVFAGLCSCEDRHVLDEFVDSCETYQRIQAMLANDLTDPSDPNAAIKIKELVKVVTESGFDTLDVEVLRAELDCRAIELRKVQGIAAAISPLQDEVEHLNAFSLKSLSLAQEVVAQVGRDVLALRNPAFETPEAAAVIRRSAQDCASLTSMRESIEERLEIPSDISASQLRSCANDLDKAGILSVFSSDVRYAKRLLKGLFRERPPKGKDAAVVLRKLAQWKDAHQEFLDDPAYKNCFNLHFAGLETDFGLFERLIEFYEDVESKLRGSANRAARKLLREGSIETLFELPELENVRSEATVADVNDLLEQGKNALSLAEQGFQRIGQLKDVFWHPADITSEYLKQLSSHADDGATAKAVANNHAAAKAVFRDLFQGTETDVIASRFHLQTLSEIEALPRLAPALRKALSVPEWPRLKELLSPILEADTAASAKVHELGIRSGKNFDDLTTSCAFGLATDHLMNASQDEQGLSANVRLSKAFSNLHDLGFNWVQHSITKQIEDSEDRLANLLEAAVYRSMSSKIMEMHGDALNRYQGLELNEMRAKLAELDKQLLSLSRQQLRAKAVAASNPQIGIGSGPKRNWTELSLIENEIAKQKRFVSVRDLTQRAGRALQELKPCWMMSPLAVAQYLPAQAIRFDLCIIDEASQMRPEDALGALARCDQAMIVGDVNQLPPSNFFQKMIDDDEDDEDGTAVDEESILEISNARLRPNRRLRWHYRSQHSNLIRFSNELIYDKNLVIFPSSDEQRPDMGVSLVPVKGLYHNSVNPIEAKVVVDAALRFMRERSNESLGIVTLNQKQRDLIIDEMNYALERDEIAAKYVDDWAERSDGLERFFVKNLENVQGDERDVIYIGTVYGPEREGIKPMQRFGPINGVAGRRRLNVLFTRAKKQIITFSSLRAPDITATETSNAGTYMLKRWLEYSATNILERPEVVNPDTDSDFEDYVIQQIKAMGCEAVPQVGSAGYRIDIGVKHPDWPYGFLLAVECDGATYHSCRAARDRDRLRQEVLERLGWSFHRIWSTDWFNDPRAETERLRKRISDRLFEVKAKHSEQRPLSESLPRVEPTDGKEAYDVRDLDLVTTTEEKVDVKGNSQGHRKAPYIEVGDTVRVTYLSGSKASLQVTITPDVTDPNDGIISAHEPLAEALLGAEQGEEVEVLVGSYVRKAIIEDVKKLAAA